MKNFLFLILVFCVFSLQLKAQSMNVSYKEISEKDTEQNYTINAEYPNVDFGPDALMGVRGIADDINNSIDTIIQNKIKDFKREVSQITDKTALNGIGSSLEITSKSNIISGTFFTAQIKEFSAVMGMAHPNTFISSFNYSTVSTGLLQSLSDLFIPGSDYLKYISDYCISELKSNSRKKGYTNIDDMIIQGASEDINNFSVWNITEDSLIITFNHAQAAPYVFGIQTVSIPLANITEMINPKGPLAFMFR